MYDLIGLAAGVCFILALKGLSHPKTARRGNLIGALGATIATLVVFAYNAPLNNLGWIIGAIAVGSLIGVPAARRVQMTQMPQLVALFNGVGGGAAALVAIVEYLALGDGASTAVVIFTVFTVVVGCVSFSGSLWRRLSSPIFVNVFLTRYSSASSRQAAGELPLGWSG
jgi:NAD(P) transhydrogenase subunit beta